MAFLRSHGSLNVEMVPHGNKSHSVQIIRLKQRVMMDLLPGPSHHRAEIIYLPHRNLQWTHLWSCSFTEKDGIHPKWVCPYPKPCTSKIPVFKCQRQRPALLSAKVNHHFQPQTLTGSETWAELIINQRRGMWLSLPPTAGMGRP